MSRIDSRTFYATNLPVESRDSRGNWHRDTLGVYNRDTFKGRRCYVHFNGGIFQIDEPTAAAMIHALEMWINDNPTEQAPAPVGN